MSIPPIFIVFILFASYIFYSLKKNDPSIEGDLTFFTKDAKANFTSKKPIDKEHFVIADIENLPFNTSTNNNSKRLLRLQDEALIASKKKMINFKTEISNKDLKLKFGYANLELISTYEEHYRQYIWTLIRWAEALLNEEMYEDAIIILNHSIDFGSTISKSYTLLADIYNKKNDIYAIDKILKNVIENNIESKGIIEKHIKSLQS